MKILLPGFPTLNEYIQAERGNKHAAAAIKKESTDFTAWACKAARMQAIEKPVVVRCTWREPDKRKDPDNVAFSIKFILDGFVKAGVLKNDGPRQIKSIHHLFEYGAKVRGVIVELVEE